LTSFESANAGDGAVSLMMGAGATVDEAEVELLLIDEATAAAAVADILGGIAATETAASLLSLHRAIEDDSAGNFGGADGSTDCVGGIGVGFSVGSAVGFGVGVGTAGAGAAVSSSCRSRGSALCVDTEAVDAAATTAVPVVSTRIKSIEGGTWRVTGALVKSACCTTFSTAGVSAVGPDGGLVDAKFVSGEVTSSG